MPKHDLLVAMHEQYGYLQVGHITLPDKSRYLCIETVFEKPGHPMAMQLNTHIFTKLYIDTYCIEKFPHAITFGTTS